MSTNRNDNWDMENATGERAEIWKPKVGDFIKVTLEKLEIVPDYFEPAKKARLRSFRDESEKVWNWFPPTDVKKKIIERFKRC